MQQIKVWEALIIQPNGDVTVMRLSGYDSREVAMQAARGRLKLVKSKAKVKACRFSHNEEA